MQQENNEYQSKYRTQENQKTPTSFANKILIKGLITGALILAMLVPTLFVDSLVKEREQRQREVVQEVKRGWANEQTVFGPYIHIPYTAIDIDKKVVQKSLFVLPENSNVEGNISPEIRKRSIYKVLLYKSNITSSGNFIIKLPSEVDVNTLQLDKAKICYSISDIKGIDEKVLINFNGKEYECTPGLPNKDFETFIPTGNNIDYVRVEAGKQIEITGLSASIDLTNADFEKPLSFNSTTKIKGSEQLHFIPIGSNSKFKIESKWASPKFDGSTLPNSNDVKDSGFTANWTFTKSNSAIAGITKDFGDKKMSYAFGVSLIQPTDYYSKINRCLKYALLFIGLTFGLFFIIEIMQKKPVHPVQYVLIGLALIIFFTLLLSISEFLYFDVAYIAAAFATIILISAYAKAHFKNIKTAFVFGTFLTILYAFIFVLISLEDMALLIGSIGLFCILAIVMFGSRKIDWYGKEVH